MAANAGELVEGLSIGLGAVITSSALASASGFMLVFVLSNSVEIRGTRRSGAPGDIHGCSSRRRRAKAIG